MAFFLHNYDYAKIAKRNLTIKKKYQNFAPQAF